MFKGLVSALALSVSGVALAASAPTIDVKRTVMISGPIGGASMLVVGDKLLELSKKNQEPVSLIINSPGGDVAVGYIFIDYMAAVKAKGVKIQCFVPQFAASMAFQILLHCDERYALEHALLLFHGARVFASGQEIDGTMARQLADELGEVNVRITGELENKLRGMSKDDIHRHFERQTLHVAEDLARKTQGFITVLPAIPGLLGIKPGSVPTNTPPGLFGFLNRIVYIYEDATK